MGPVESVKDAKIQNFKFTKIQFSGKKQKVKTWDSPKMFPGMCSTQICSKT